MAHAIDPLFTDILDSAFPMTREQESSIADVANARLDDMLSAGEGEELTMCETDNGAATEIDGRPITPAPAPFVLADMDEDVVADLAAVGVHVDSDAAVRELDRARRETMAATLLRYAAGCDRELRALSDAMELELQAVRAHYERRMAPITSRRAALTRHVCYLAEIAAAAHDWGKKKSGATPWGTFGVRDSAATVEIADEAALLAHLKAADPDRVRVVAKLTLADAVQYFGEAERDAMKHEILWNDLKKSISLDAIEAGTVPPGVAVVPAKREAFAKPEHL